MGKVRSGPRKGQEVKIFHTNGYYHCTADEGSGSGKCKMDYKNTVRRYVLTQQGDVHYNKGRRNAGSRKYMKIKRSTTNLASYVSFRKESNAPLLPKMEYNDGPDWEDNIPLAVRRDLAQIDASENKKYAERRDHYNGNHFVAYLPEKPDIGPEATFAMRTAELLRRGRQRRRQAMSDEEKAKYIFFHYFGTSHPSRKVCKYLDGTTDVGVAELIRLLSAGYVCWRQDFKFSGGSKDENTDRAMHWQHFYKNVKLYEVLAAEYPEKVEWKILNGGDRGYRMRKGGYDGVLSPEDRELAKKIAWQNRPLILCRLIYSSRIQRSRNGYSTKEKSRRTKARNNFR